MDWPQRVLICLRYGIGDVVMELPALRTLRAQWPAAKLTVLGARPALELLDGDPDVDAHGCVQDLGFEHWGDWGTPAAHRAFWDWFDAAQFDCVLDGSHAVAGVRTALMHTPVQQFNTDDVFHHDLLLSGGSGADSIWRAAVQAWGLDAEPPAPRPQLHISEPARRWAQRFLLAHGPVAGVIGLAPIASSEIKRWPLERVAQLIRWLGGECNRQVLVFGIQDHGSAAQRLRQAAAPATFEIVAPRHLQETAALIARCDAFLSNDTGLMHMAAAVDTPTVGIFGPTAPQVYLPAGAIAVGGEPACSYRAVDRFGPPACVLQGRCLVAANSCVTAISIDAVRNALEDALEAGTPTIELNGGGIQP